MSEEVLVSIIAPMFNGEEYIERFINMILKQDYSNWELILVDDGSKDNTVLIARKMAENDARITVLQRDRDPKGSVTCRNIGQRAAKGKYFIHLDSDDLLASCLVGQRVKFMEEHPEVDYASARGEHLLLHEDGTITYNGKPFGVDPKKELLKCFLRYDYPYSVWNNIYRSSSFKEYCWDETVKIRTDFSYIIPALIAGYKHAFIEESKPDYFYLNGVKNSISSEYISQEKFESTNYLFQKTLDQISTIPHAKTYKKIFRATFTHQLIRIATAGSKEQLEEYYAFYLSSYKEYPNIRLKLLYWLVLSRRKPKGYSVGRLKLWIYAFLRPSRVLLALKVKMKSHKSARTFVMPE